MNFQITKRSGIRMRRIGLEKYKSQRSRRYILAAAVIIILLFTTSLSHPGLMSADQQHITGKLNQNGGSSDSGEVSIPDYGTDSGSASQIAVQCGVLKLRQSTESTAQIPLYCISGKFHGEFVPSNLPHRELPVIQGVSLPATELTRWGAYLLNGGSNHGYLLLAPRSWKVVTAETGMNGSVKVEMQDSGNPRIHMTYQDVGACMGCAAQMMGSYFPDMRKWAEEQGFAGEPPVFESRVELNEHMTQFVLNNDNGAYKTYGAAYRFLDPDNAQFTSLEIEAPEAQVQTVHTMLDFYAKHPTAFVY
ncbi:DUF4850 domain-containing protein [Paenibacillus azoreducens]|uniref:DUF4850 domain-containing protein n=1 Tax=Paenibacillus azoreducens TaxID=116718 RepID=UPI0039F6258B